MSWDSLSRDEYQVARSASKHYYMNAAVLFLTTADHHHVCERRTIPWAGLKRDWQ